SCSASAATARCCARSACSMGRRYRCSASTSAGSAISPRARWTDSSTPSSGALAAPRLVDALQRFVAGPESGGWHLDRRMMLDVDVRDAVGTPLGRWCALNEAVVEKRLSGQTVQLQVLIDGEPFTSYAADGLIVSTP